MSYPITNTISLYAGGTIAVGTTYAVIQKVPADSEGGGLSVVEAGVISRGAQATGSALTVELVYLGTNSAVAGTIGTVAAGAFTAGTAKKMTVTQTFVDADKYLAWKVMGTAVNGDQQYVTAYVTYWPGY